MTLRFLIWSLIFYIIWKLVRIYINSQKNKSMYTQSSQKKSKPVPPFSDVQEAQFEDLTPKTPSDKNQSDTKH